MQFLILESNKMYTITLKNCAFFAYHGALREENNMGQRFYIDATLEVEPSKPLHYDDLDHVVDYGNVFEKIESIVSKTRFVLIESLAQNIARQLLDTFSLIKQAHVTVRKPSAPIKGLLDYVEVSVIENA
jgi:7,8-dihydroneopterin aldolase/epimerase/oxygenase